MTLQEFINKWDCIPLIGFEGGYGLELKEIHWLEYNCYDLSTGPDTWHLNWIEHVEITCCGSDEIDNHLAYIDTCMPRIIRANWPTDESGYGEDHAITKSITSISRETYDKEVLEKIFTSLDKYGHAMVYETISSNNLQALNHLTVTIDPKINRTFIK